MRIWDIITGKARRERKEAETRAERTRAAQAAAKWDEDSSVLRRDHWTRDGGVERARVTSYGIDPAPGPDITNTLNPANPFYGTGYDVSGGHPPPPAPDCSPAPSSGGGDGGGSCGGGGGGGD